LPRILPADSPPTAALVAQWIEQWFPKAKGPNFPNPRQSSRALNFLIRRDFRQFGVILNRPEKSQILKPGYIFWVTLFSDEFTGPSIANSQLLNCFDAHIGEQSPKQEVTIPATRLRPFSFRGGVTKFAIRQRFLKLVDLGLGKRVVLEPMRLHPAYIKSSSGSVPVTQQFEELNALHHATFYIPWIDPSVLAQQEAQTVPFRH